MVDAWLQCRPTVLSPDLLGYGSEAVGDAADITIDAQMEYVKAVADRAVGQSSVHLVGHSVGGVIAASFIHRFPDRVTSLVNLVTSSAPSLLEIPLDPVTVSNLLD
ncbi:MAG: alpha/beta fold hydrolase [Candidatus Dormibacteraceae bacterium]